MEFTRPLNEWFSSLIPLVDIQHITLLLNIVIFMFLLELRGFIQKIATKKESED